MSLVRQATYRIPNTEELRRRASRKRSIPFRILVVGEAGIGKRTFCNNLCGSPLFDETSIHLDGKNSSAVSSTAIVEKHFDLVEADSFPVGLDFVLISNLGDEIDNSSSCNVVSEYLETQFDRILMEEIRIKRNMHTIDTRPHVCLYFVRATSRGLSEFEIKSMKSLCDKVNLIPIIGKADTLTEKELELNKQLILSDIRKNQISLYDFGEHTLKDLLIVPDYKGSILPVHCEIVENTHVIQNNDVGSPIENASGPINELLPFSVVGGIYTELSDGEKPKSSRTYPWGTVMVENPDHSNFTHLKNILLGSHLQELKDKTHEVLYENYRMKKLQTTNFGTNDVNRSILAESTALGKDTSNTLGSPDNVYNLPDEPQQI